MHSGVPIIWIQAQNVAVPGEFPEIGMSRSQDQFAGAGVQCRVCHSPVSSSRHSERCGHAANEVFEVVPPLSVWPIRNTGHNSVQAEFFPMVSAAHEFKTPLVVMLGYTDLLRNGHLGPVNDRQKQVLGEIQESAERLHKLIHDLLLLSELKTGNSAKNELAEAEPEDVNDHLKDIFKYWAPRAVEKSIRYEFQPAVGNPKVGVESLKLQHIVSNLIENALKFTPAEGNVTVKVTSCFWERRKAQSAFLFNMERKRNERVENAVRIDVIDSGPGIPPEHHHDIFLDFVQLPGTSSRGTGLGLAIARRLVEKCGGVIWVESEVGKGSTFSLLLSQTR